MLLGGGSVVSDGVLLADGSPFLRCDSLPGGGKRYYYRVRAYNSNGSSAYVGRLRDDADSVRL